MAPYLNILDSCSTLLRLESTQIPKLQVFNGLASNEDMPGLQGRMYPPKSSSYDCDVVQDPDLPNRFKFKHSAPIIPSQEKKVPCRFCNHQIINLGKPAKSWVAGDLVHKRRCHQPKQMVPPVTTQSSGCTAWSWVANKVFGLVRIR